MKKILVSLSIIAAVAALAVGATSAVFSDTETSTGNTFSAGTLILGVDGNNDGTYTDTGTFTVDPATLGPIAPGQSTTLTIPVKNMGTLPLVYTVATPTTDAGSNPNSLFAVQSPIAPDTTAGTPATVNASPLTGTLAAGGSTTITITVELPLTAGNQYQDDSGVVNVTINATQQ